MSSESAKLHLVSTFHSQSINIHVLVFVTHWFAYAVHQVVTTVNTGSSLMIKCSLYFILSHTSQSSAIMALSDCNLSNAFTTGCVRKPCEPCLLFITCTLWCSRYCNQSIRLSALTITQERADGCQPNSTGIGKL